MDSLTQQHILELLENQYGKYQTINWLNFNNEREGFYFLGDNGVNIQLTTFTSTVKITFEDRFDDDSVPCVVELPFSVCENFIKKAFNDYCLKKDNPENLGKYYSFIMEEKIKIHEYLKNINIEDYINPSEQLYTTKINMPAGDNQFNIIKIGRLLVNGKEVAGLISCQDIPVEIYLPPIFLPKTNAKKKTVSHLETQISIPGWEVEEYPCLDRFMVLKNEVVKPSNLIEKLKNVNPALGSMFHSIVLQDIMPEKNSTIKKNKI
jgi:hypothetical protein